MAMLNVSKVTLTATFIMSLAMPASAQILVLGTGAAQECYQSTKFGDQGRLSTIRQCETAFESPLSRDDRVATHVNMGILYMRRDDNKNAQKHYKKAIDIKPSMAEIYINYGASLIHIGDYEGAVNAINKAIELKTEKMPEALYNRSIAYNRLQNYKGAYYDLKEALMLKPEWPVALKALENYTVTKRPKSN